MNDRCLFSDKIRVLLIDDEISLLGPMQIYLQDFGYYVDTAKNGAEAFELLDQNSGLYDIAMIDYSLIPGPNGIEIMKRIKSKYGHIECIIITGWGLQNRHEALREGAFRYIEKEEAKQEIALHTRAAAQQVRLRMIGLSMMEQHDLKDILDAMIASSKALVFADDAAIVIQDHYSKQLMLYRSLTSQVITPLHDLDRSIWDQIFLQDEIVSIPNIMMKHDANEALQTCGYYSFIGLPIAGENKNIGAMYLFSENPHHFDEYSNTAILQTMASYTAMAVQSAWADHELKQHGIHMEALVKVSRRLTECNRLDDQFILAWEFVRDQLGVTTFFAGIYDPDKDKISFPVGFDNGKPLKIDSRKISAQEDWGASGYVIKNRREVYWRDRAEEQEFCEQSHIEAFVHGNDCECCFYIPIIIDNQAAGVISIQSAQADSFPEFLLDSCRALSSQLSAAIKNTRLYEGQEKRANEAETLRKISLALSTTIELDSIINKILIELKKVVPYDTASVQLLKDSKKGQFFEIIAGYGFPAIDRVIGAQFPVDGPYPNSEVYKYQKPLSFSHVSEKFEIFRTPPHDGVPIHDWLGIPMLVGDRMIGLIALDKQQSPFYTQEHCHLAEAFASQASVAVDNACHHEETEKVNRLLKTLEEYSRHIRPEKEPEKLFHETARLAAELLEWSMGAVFIYLPHLRELELETLYQLPETLKGLRLTNPTGPLGTAAYTGELAYFPNPSSNLDIDKPFEDYPGFECIKSAIFIPLRYGNDVDRVLMICDGEEKEISKTDLEIIQRFAAQASIALQSSRSYDKGERRMTQLYILQKVSEAIEARKDIRKILHMILTGVTAGYGLGFNRAVLLRIQDDQIISLLAIGHQDADIAREDWEESHLNRMDEFKRYLEALWQDQVPASPLGETFAEKSFSFPADQNELIMKHLEGNRILRLQPEELVPFHAFYELYQPTSEVLIAPIRSENQVIGMLIVDNKVTQTPITSQDTENVLTFTKSVAVALENHQAFSELQRSRERLQRTRNAARDVAKVTVQGVLKETLTSICNAAREVSGCSLITLYVYDAGKNRFTEMEHYGSNGKGIVREPNEITPTSCVWFVLNLEKPYYYLTTCSAEDPYFKSDFVDDEEIIATLGIKLVYQEKPVGVLFMNYREPHVFEKEELETTLMFAELAANAIQNAQSFDLINRHKKYLEVLYQAGNLITSSLSLEDRLVEISKQAVNLSDATGSMPLFCDVLLVIDNQLTYKVTFPEEYSPKRKIHDVNTRPMGVIGRAYYLGESQLVLDTSQDVDYRDTGAVMLSELAVPMKDPEGHVIGIINIESPEKCAFDEENKTQLEFLAVQAAIAINNVQVYEELRKSKGMIGGRQALAWMGMTSSYWQHKIRADLNIVELEVELIKIALKQNTLAHLDEHLSKILRKTQAIQNVPLTPTLSSSDGIDKILVNQLISQRAEQHIVYHAGVEISQSFELPEHYTCRANREWLKRAFDLLMDNAVEAVLNREQKLITVGTRLLDAKTAEIFIIDNGPGIKPEILKLIGIDRIEKPEDAEGFGMGLLMAEMILNAYGGRIYPKKTGPSGTEMVMQIPVIEYIVQES
jgi:GAF domain-containing protein/ActR/RegA family two-component response regulator